MKTKKHTKNTAPDFAMFSEAGNQAVAEMIAEITADGPVSWRTVRRGLIALEPKHGEADDTAVRDEVYGWLLGRDLMTDNPYWN